MIGNEERRKVARRLRELDHVATDRDAIESGADKLVKAVYGDRPYSPIERSARNLRGLAMTLASLVDRPTCRNVDDGRELECSERGMQRRLLDRADALEERAHVRNPGYCPHCGRKAVRDGD